MVWQDRPSSSTAIFNFAANDGSTGVELWKSDGTEPGTVRVANISADSESGPRDSNPHLFTIFNDTLYFAATNNSNPESPEPGLFKVTPSGDGVESVRTFPGNESVASFGIDSIAVVGESLFFVAMLQNVGESAYSNELWQLSSDGALGKVSDVTSPLGLTVVNNELYFLDNHPDLVIPTDSPFYQLMRLDVSADTPTGANVSGDVRLFDGAEVVAFGEQVVFTGAGLVDETTDETGVELWSIGGGNAPALLADVWQGESAVGIGGGELAPNSSFPEFLTVVGSEMLFSAMTDDGRELWKVNAEGIAELVLDMNPGNNPNPNSSFPSQFTVMGQSLFFTALAPVDPGQFSNPNSERVWWLAEYKDGIVGFYPSVRSDGMTSPPSSLTAVGDALYFAFDDGTHGTELWRVVSGGSPELVKDIAVPADFSRNFAGETTGTWEGTVFVDDTDDGQDNPQSFPVRGTFFASVNAAGEVSGEFADDEGGDALGGLNGGFTGTVDSDGNFLATAIFGEGEGEWTLTWTGTATRLAGGAISALGDWADTLGGSGTWESVIPGSVDTAPDGGNTPETAADLRGDFVLDEQSGIATATVGITIPATGDSLDERQYLRFAVAPGQAYEVNVTPVEGNDQSAFIIVNWGDISSFAMGSSSATFSIDDADLTLGAEVLVNIMGVGAYDVTVTARDSNPSSSPAYFVATPEGLAFAADDGENGREPWFLPLSSGGAGDGDTDTTSPSLSILPDVLVPLLGVPFGIRFVLSEAGTTFGASDVTVSGGTLSNFAASQDPTQPNTYTATVTPTQIGPLTVSVAAGAFTDASGNPNIQGSTAFSVDAGFSSLDPAVVIGTVEFGNTGLGYALRVGGADGAVVQVKQAGQYVSQLGDWVGIGARADGAGGYELLWQNDTQFFGWALDADGNYLAGAFLTPDEIFGLETDLNLDINGDGDVGLPPS